jgi:hypothetical protein
MQAAPDSQFVDALGAIERFVVDNDDLLELEKLIGRFNIFDALGIVRAEKTHSDFLAFILDPAESHGQSQLFLRAVLMDLLRAAPADRRPLSPIEIDRLDLRGVSIRREWNNLDLLIVSQQPSFVIAIENKVDSGEHSDQLERYMRTVAKHFPAIRPLYVFLTPSGLEASHSDWLAYGYKDLYRALFRVIESSANAIGGDVKTFLDHYLILIGSRFMDDNPRLDELCQRIYKNHRQALQLIYERVGRPTAGVMSDVESCVRKDNRWHVFQRTSDWIGFVPKHWTEWLPSLGLDQRDDRRSWLMLRVEVRSQHISFLAEVRRMADLQQRRRIVKELLDNGRFGFSRRGKVTVSDSYTRLTSRERLLVWEENEVPESEDVCKAVQQKLDDLYPKLAGMRDLILPLL